MFNDMPAPMVEVMRRLEARDERDRADGTAHLERLRQIPPETGRFIALLAASAPDRPPGAAPAPPDRSRARARPRPRTSR